MMYEFKMYSPCCKWYLEIQTNCQKVEELIVNLFGGFIVSQKAEKDNLELLNVTVLKCDSGYVMTGKGKTYKIKDLRGVGFYLYAVIDKLVEGNMDEKYCVLHGGVIARDKTAYCVIAPTMTGKSTLIAYLALNGYDYLADDYIFVDRVQRTITPIPLPVSLRDTSILGDSLKNQFVVSGYNELRGENCTLVSLAHDSKVRYLFTRILIIQRTDYNDYTIMNKGDLYKSLLFNMKNGLDLERERLTVNALVDHINGYKLSYKNLRYAKEYLDLT